MIHRTIAGISALTILASVAMGDPGDSRRIEFTLPASAAFQMAQDQHRLLFLKPIYGGVNPAGYADYRCGSW